MAYNREIERLTWQLDELKRAQEHFENNLGSERKLATLLHNRTCKLSHDRPSSQAQCAWIHEELFPDTWERSRTVHDKYLSKAKEILAAADYETAVKIIDILYP